MIIKVKNILFPLRFLPLRKVTPAFDFVTLGFIFITSHFIVSTDIIQLSVFGMDPEIQKKFGNPNIWLFSLLSASLFLGNFVGGFIFQKWNLKLCRVEVFQLSLLAWITISVVQIINPFDYTQALITRFFKGLTVSTITYVISLYMSEIFPQCVSLVYCLYSEFAQVFGILATYAAGSYVINHDHKMRNFRLLCGIPLLLAGIIYFCSIYLPQSPFWLVTQGHYDKAQFIQNQLAQKNNLEDYPLRNKVELVEFYLTSDPEFKNSYSLKKTRLLFITMIKVTCGVFTIQCYSFLFNKLVGENETQVGLAIPFFSLLGFALFLVWFHDSKIKSKNRFTTFIVFNFFLFIINVINCILCGIAFRHGTVRNSYITGIYCLILLECAIYPLMTSTFPIISKIDFFYKNRKSKIPFICTQIETVLISLYFICVPSLLTDLKHFWGFFLLLGCVTLVLIVTYYIVYSFFGRRSKDNTEFSKSSDAEDQNKNYGSDPIILTEFV